MKYPYVITSDQHHHAWSQFAKIGPDGLNTRLSAIIAENERAARTVVEKGGCVMFLAGDLFHVRGEIKPSVFNPTNESFKRICKSVDVEAIPGNHDLEGNDADALGNAMQQLGNIQGFNVHTEPTVVEDVVVIPWFHDLDHLREQLRKFADPKRDCIIHAPVDGVLKGLPKKSLTPEELASFGYRRVFAGHYHHHAVFEGGKVVSVGATTHQTWNDPGTVAGFLLVYEDRIEHVPSAAPAFVDLTADVIANLNVDEDIDALVRGNYVRLKLEDVTEKDIKDWRKDLDKAGALGVTVIATKKATTGRSGASTKAASSLDASVQHYIDNDMKPLLAAEVAALAQECLDEARS